MASKNVDIHDNNVNTFTGMTVDYEPQMMPKNMYRYALNALSNKIGSLITENSNELCADSSVLTDLDFYVGKIETDNTVVVLYKDTNGYDRIVEIDENCNVITDLTFDCLNFDRAIHGTWQLLNGCDKWIYFTDGENPIRKIKLDNNYYNTTNGVITDCSDTKLIKDIRYPRFVDAEIINNGSLYSGSYNFAIRYIDDGGNPTRWLIVSMPINIYKGNNSDNYKGYLKTHGTLNIDFDGSLGETKANKSIKLYIDNIDTRYKYYQIAVIKDVGVFDVSVSPNILITSETDYFIYTGNETDFEAGDISEIQFNQYQISTAKAIESYQHRLILANTSEQKRDLCKLNRYAITTRVTYNTFLSGTSLQDEYDPKNSIYTFKHWGFMPGEVYALGLIYVFKNGDISPVFHIPGRPFVGSELDNVAGNDPDNFINAATRKGFIYDTSEEASLHLGIDNLLWVWEEQDDNLVYKRPRCTKDNDCIDKFWTLISSSEDSRIPSGFPYNNEGESLLGKRYRHHRIPTRKTIPIGTYDNVSSYICSKGLEVDVSGIVAGEHTLTIDYTNCDGDDVSSDIDISISDGDTTIVIEEFMFCKQTCDSLGNVVNHVYIDGEELDSSKYTEISKETHTVGSSLKKNIVGLNVTTYIPQGEDIVGVMLVVAHNDNNLVLTSGYLGKNYPCTCAESDLDNVDDHPQDNENYIYDSMPVKAICHICTEDSSGDYDAWSDYVNNSGNNKIISFINETLNKEKHLDTFTYIRYNNIISGDLYPGICNGGYACEQISDTWDDSNDTRFSYGSFYPKTVGRVEFIAKKEKAQVLQFASRSDVFDTTYKLVNASQSSDILVIKTNKSFAGMLIPEQAHLAYLMRHLPVVFGELDTIRYYSVTNGVLEADIVDGSNIAIYGGGAFTTFHNRHDIDIRAITSSGLESSDIQSMLSQHHDIISSYTYDITDVCNTATSKQNRLPYQWNRDKYYCDSSTDTYGGQCGDAGDRQVVYNVMFSNDLPIDTYVNTGLALAFPGVSELYNRWELHYADYGSGYEYWSKHVLDDSNGSPKERVSSGPLSEYFAFSTRYYRLKLGKDYMGIPMDFDICGDCINKFPHSIFWSRQQLGETDIDNWTQFDPLNYNTIPTDTGEINAIKQLGQQLYVFTTNAVFYYPMPTQQIINSDMNIYVGTGEFLSIGPFKIPYEFGMQDAISIIETDIGLFFIDYLRKSIFNLKQNSAVNNISFLFMKSFFSDAFEYIYPQPNPYRDDHSMIIGLDSANNRLLFTVRYQNTIDGINPLKSDEIESFTISFDYIRNSWVSFHSYKPNIYLHNSNKMYSGILNGIYRHGKDYSFLEFYGQLNNFEVDIVSVNNPLLSKRYEYVIVYTKTYKYENNDSDFYEDKYKTFTKFVAYTSKGSTGYLDIDILNNSSNVFASYLNTDNSVHVANYKNNSLVLSRLIDNVFDYSQPLFIRRFGNIYKINTSVINTNKSFSDLSNLFDRFIGIYLIYEPQQSPTNEDSQYMLEVDVMVSTDKTNL